MTVIIKSNCAFTLQVTPTHGLCCLPGGHYSTLVITQVQPLCTCGGEPRLLREEMAHVPPFPALTSRHL